MKILNELTIKHLKMNKKRTIVTIIGIILSTALMVGIGLLFSTIQDNAIRTTKEENGDYHALLYGLNNKKLDVLANNHHVDNYFYEAPVGFSEFSDSKMDNKKYFFINAVSDKYFKEMKLIKGRFPENSNEIVIPNHLELENGTVYQIGDEITLKIGPRKFADMEYYENDAYYEDEPDVLVIKEERTYKVVGIIEKPVFEDYNAAGYTFLTKIDLKDQDINVYLTFKKPSRAYQDMNSLIKNLGMSEEAAIEYNNSLLALYGASRYGNIMQALINVMIIMLTLVSVGCIIVIYNSFAISVMERKKQFGLFSSIGATKKQLRQTVFFEAIIVGLIGIPLGVLGSFIGIGIVIEIINYLVPNLFGTNLVLTAYPIFLGVPIAFMIVTILVSAYIPALKASKITPIEAIRLNDDIKIKNRKLKTGKWIQHLFGVEGEIALKNIKRNKKKYRITIVSLFISIVLFLSFSTFVEYGMKTSSDTLNIPDYDIQLMVREPSTYQIFVDTVKNYEGVEKSIVIRDGLKYTNSYKKEELYNSDLMDYIQEEDKIPITIISLDDTNYKSYLNELGLTEERPILIDKTKYISYKNNNRKVYNTTILKDPKRDYQFNMCERTDDEVSSLECNGSLENIYITEKSPYAVDNLLTEGNLIIVVSKTTFDQLFIDNEGYYDSYYTDSIYLYLKAPKYKKVDQYIMDYKETLSNKGEISYFNYPKDMKEMKNLYIVVGLLLYGFITLVTLIGVTSVFNTINTSIQLRRKEFAMLRSMGLTPHGFNKILYFESFFFGIKSLLYGIPFSFLVILWIHSVMSGVSSFGRLLIPWKSIGIAVLAVFVIVFLTMMYATKKMKKENILDAIREENI